MNMGGVDLSLASKSLDLCQALIGQGKPFNFSLSYTGTSYTFSLDTRSKDTPSPQARKKPSPSTSRRNARRREDFLKRKAETTSKAMDTTTDKSEVHNSWSSELVGSAKSVKVKLKKKPPDHIPQVDGHNEESSSDAEDQTKDTKPKTKDAAVQADYEPSPEVKEAFERLFPK